MSGLHDLARDFGTPLDRSGKAEKPDSQTGQGTIVMPVPADAPAPRLDHPNHGRPTRTWTYRDASGAVLFYVQRFDPPGERKQFAPQTLWRDGGDLRWRRCAPPSPRPLYGLDRLAAHPDASVVVCEGEKSADAAQKVFPDWVAVASYGGAKAAGKADWAALAGRSVMIWPDAGEPGGKYAEDVQRELVAVGAAAVSMVDAMRVAAVLPDGGGRTPKDGWDAADGLGEDGWQPEALATLVLQHVAVAELPADDGPLTEDAAALVFAAQHGGKLLYCHDEGSWYEWTGAAWIPNKRKVAFHAAREIARELCKTASGKAIFIASKAAFAEAVEKFSRADPTFAVTSEVFDHDPWLLGTPGGTVDLRTGELRPAEPGERITKLTAVAPTEAPDCPRWLRFLDEATKGDKDLIRFLQQWSGYSLTGITREHALVFVYGPGGNGKSVFLNALTGILGEYARTAAMETFTATKGDKHPTDLAMLRGARLVTASETEEDRAWAEARIKSLTGGDPITARFMRQDFFTFTPTFKLTIVGNHQPMLRNVDEAARRRFNIIPFVHKPDEKDKDPELEEKLRAEWPAILRWMIEGCRDWQKSGLVRPATVTKATKAYFDDQDLFGQWIEERCEKVGGDKTSVSALYGSWADFADKSGEEPGSLKGFSSAMRRKGFMPYRDAKGRGFSGIRLIPDTTAYSYRDASRGPTRSA